MKIRNLAEEFANEYIVIKIKEETFHFPIHKNPTSDDYREMKKENGTQRFRYIVKIYGEPVLYVFDSRALHFQAAEVLKIGYKHRIHLPVWGDYAFGESELINNKLELNTGIVKELKRMGKNIPYGFLEQYFINAPEKPQKKEHKRIFRS